MAVPGEKMGPLRCPTSTFPEPGQRWKSLRLTTDSVFWWCPGGMMRSWLDWGPDLPLVRRSREAVDLSHLKAL